MYLYNNIVPHNVHAMKYEPTLLIMLVHVDNVHCAILLPFFCYSFYVIKLLIMMFVLRCAVVYV